VNERWAGAVDLLAQVGDVGLDDGGVAADVVLPQVVEELRLRQHPPCVRQQERNRLYSVGDSSTGRPARRTTWASSSSCRSASTAPTRTAAVRCAQQRLDARDHLLEAERLRHVVVAAQRQAPHRLLGAVSRGEEQHRRVVALAPQPPAHLETVDVGQHDVEQQEVRRVRAHGRQGAAPVTGHLDGEAEVAQRGAQEEPDVLLVVDDEDPGRRRVGGRGHGPSMPPEPVKRL